MAAPAKLGTDDAGVDPGSGAHGKFPHVGPQLPHGNGAIAALNLPAEGA
ncbi:hypothetical protein SDC9_105192 [bioreactor metagenome]|uniref:Uncharacterized protein n=1 Tax=bioreactor metagenome TaxID=1076179 RepID=A0A645B1B7_9ZZZZ